MADGLVRTPVTITSRSFPTPHVVQTTSNPALSDQLGGFAVVQADAANAALERLDSRLATATTHQRRLAAFLGVYKQVADWRYRIAQDGNWTRPGSDPEDFRAPIGDSSMAYRLSPWAGRRDERSPAHRTLKELTLVAIDRIDAAAATASNPDKLQNLVVLPDQRTVRGNLLWRGPAAQEFSPFFGSQEVITVTARRTDRDSLRWAAVSRLARLEALRAEAGGLDALDPGNRQAFADAAYFLFQGPEVQRGTDATMRTFLVAAHTRVFQVAPVLPQGIDLDAMVRGQDGFAQTMREELRLYQPAGITSAGRLGERARGGHRAAGRGPAEAGR